MCARHHTRKFSLASELYSPTTTYRSLSPTDILNICDQFYNENVFGILFPTHDRKATNVLSNHICYDLHWTTNRPQWALHPIQLHINRHAEGFYSLAVCNCKCIQRCLIFIFKDCLNYFDHHCIVSHRKFRSVIFRYNCHQKTLSCS